MTFIMSFILQYMLLCLWDVHQYLWDVHHTLSFILQYMLLCLWDVHCYILYVINSILVDHTMCKVKDQVRRTNNSKMAVLFNYVHAN
jgi:hypothetical protein